MLLALNGIPVVTAELKNPMTGQTWRDAVHQYKQAFDRYIADKGYQGIKTLVVKRYESEVKRYESEKEADGRGGWKHRVIRLLPENPDFEPIVLEDVDEGEVSVIAELREVLG